MSRTDSSLKNLYSAMIGQISGLFISVISRRIFLIYLNEDYLGLNGLFSNILTVFSLVELGIGPAMNFALYKPLATHNTEQLKSLMVLYRKAYILIGCCIASIGIMFTPFYTMLMKEIPDIPHLTLIYWLFTANTVISYFFSYKRALVICDEKRYIATTYHYICIFLMNLMQMVALIATHNYILFLVLQVVFTFVENVSISYKADRLYPYLREKGARPLSAETVQEIRKNVIAMIFHKIGGMVVLSTDNLILSKFVGLVAVGIYSNYYLITNTLNSVIGQIFASLTASIGNLNALKDEENKLKLRKMFEHIFFMNCWIYGCSSCCLWVLLNPFISLWLNDNVLLDNFTVLIIVINFYLYGVRRTAVIYREATGAFYFDRYKPLAESAVNLIVSVILVKKMGIAGVFLGTIISTLTTCIVVEPYVLYKHVFQTGMMPYIRRLVAYTAVTLTAAALTSLLAWCLRINSTFITFVVKVIICGIVPNLVFLVCFFRTDHFKYFMSFLHQQVIGHIQKKN